MPLLADRNSCTGCGACASSCIHKCICMEPDEYGFIYPAINETNCVQCGLCEQRCPILKKQNPNTFSSMPKAYAAYTKDEFLRKESSSGGVFSELAIHILAHDGVVFGAAYDEQFNVYHIGIDKIEDLIHLRGAKYSQSKLGDTFQNVQQYLKSGRMVLFSGTPCQVAGLKSFLHREYNNLFCVDFVCHGVPSPMAWKAYVEYRVKKDYSGELPRSINLRSKETGWSRYRYSNVFKYENGKRSVCSSSDSLFMKLFVGDYICSPSCENCSFKGYSRISDFTLGDFWGIWDFEPEMDDDRGTSIILCQSEKGAKLLDRISDKLVIKQVALEETSRQNQSMLIASHSTPRRQEALDMIKVGNIADCEKWFYQPKETIVEKLQHMVSNMLRKRK